MKDEQDTEKREQAEHHFGGIETPAVNERVKDGREKAGQREADHAYGYVGVFDAAVKEQPVQCYYYAGAANGQDIFPGKFFKSALEAE